MGVRYGPGMKKRYASAELMQAIDNVAVVTAHGLDQLRGEMNVRFAQVDARFEKLEYSMNKRFDSVDLRFDVFDRRLQILEARP